MPKNSAEYQREYRKRNLEKIRAYERDRCKRRNGKACVEVVTATKPVEPPKATSAGKCLYCFNTETELFIIQGVSYPVCKKHVNKVNK